MFYFTVHAEHNNAEPSGLRKSTVFTVLSPWRRYDDPCPSLLWFFPPITFSFTPSTKRFVRRVTRFVDSYSSSNIRFDRPIEPRSKDLIFNIVLWRKITVSPPHVAISIAFHTAFNEILVSTLSGIIPRANSHVRV